MQNEGEQDQAVESAKSAKVCLSCGFCCDGTLFGYVQLDEELLKEEVKIRLGVSENQQRKQFLQPCPAFHDGRCEVYSNRPQACQRFECKLLKQVKQGRVSPAQAHVIINEVRENLEAIRDICQTFGLEFSIRGVSELPGKLREVDSIAKDDVSLRRLAERVCGLRLKLQQHFGKRFSSRGKSAKG